MVGNTVSLTVCEGLFDMIMSLTIELYVSSKVGSIETFIDFVHVSVSL